jgi:hypothetical protein
MAIHTAYLAKVSLYRYMKDLRDRYPILTLLRREGAHVAKRFRLGSKQSPADRTIHRRKLPQTDTILAGERFLKLEAFGNAPRTHAAQQGRAQRTFVLDPYPEKVAQQPVLTLWMQANRPDPSGIPNLPCRIRQFSPDRLIAENLSNFSKQRYPLSQLYWSIDRLPEQDCAAGQFFRVSGPIWMTRILATPVTK